VKTLVDNNQVDIPNQDPQPRATHTIEVNELGQQILKRKNFSAF
jgi:hypothetical protein